MANWKGVEFEGDLARVVRHMPEVETYRESLQALQAVWDNLTVLGELSGTGTEITGMRSAFGQLTGTLLNSLATESRRKVAEDIQARAQVCIDILIRNLFERTADIGFLALDSDLCAFAEAAAAGRDPDRQPILERFKEYVAKYSVYSDILLLDTGGRVLCQLDETHPVGQARDPLIAEALATSAAYVEHFGPCDVAPGLANPLIYAFRVCRPGSSHPLGVLCLAFRFDNECARIFRNLGGGDDDWNVIALLDATGRVIASSDIYHLPPGAPLDIRDGAGSRIIRFAGTEYLAATRPTRGYQGYRGPGWLGHVMVPLAHAFDNPGAGALARIPAGVRQAVMNSSALFSEALQVIPRQAEAIQRELNRAVWNGNVRQSARHDSQGSIAAFSKTLLWEISKTGARTEDIFQRSIANLHETVVSAILRDCEARAALAIDVMDRNLYERANDCRWWALTTAFREALAADRIDSERALELAAILRTINGLYTVYANLILFDAQGRVVAASDPAAKNLVGRTLGDEWVRRSLALDSREAYCVSAFVPTPLYAGRPTYIYCAAVRDPHRSGRVVGGVAIVFDAEPQFAAMLEDALPARDESRPPAGSPPADSPPAGSAVFVDREGAVIASTDPDIAVGSHLALPAELLALASGHSESRIIAHAGRLHALGARMSSGYREYKGPHDRYRNDVLALVLVPLTESDLIPSGAGSLALPRAEGERQLQARGDEVVVELATFYVGGGWYGMHSSEILESIDIRRITTLPGLPPKVCGCVMYEGDPIMVMDLQDFGNGRKNGTPSQIVIVRGASDGRRLGLLVDELGEIPEVPVAMIQPVQGLFQGSAHLVDSVVRDGGRDELLLLLSADKLARLLKPAELVVGEGSAATLS